MFCFAALAAISAVAVTTTEPTIIVTAMPLLQLWLHFQEVQ